MSSPASDQNEPSKIKKLLAGNMDESIKARLPRADAPTGTFQRVQRLHPIAPPPVPEPRRAHFQFLPAFWTIASVISLTVNIILIVILLRALQTNANDQVSDLLNRLYNNLVKINQGAISLNILFLYLIIGFFVSSIPSGLYLFSYYRQMLVIRDKLEDIEREFDGDFLSLEGEFTSTHAGRELIKLISDSD